MYRRACILFVLIRYISAITIVVSNVGFFSHSFTEAACRKFYVASPTMKGLFVFESYQCKRFQSGNSCAGHGFSGHCGHTNNGCRTQSYMGQVDGRNFVRNNSAGWSMASRTWCSCWLKIISWNSSLIFTVVFRFKASSEIQWYFSTSQTTAHLTDFFRYFRAVARREMTNSRLSGFTISPRWFMTLHVYQ